MYSKYDRLIYINLAQDQLPARIDELLIHERATTLIKIPDGCNLNTLVDPNFFPEVTNRTKIYFAAHGHNSLPNLVLDRPTGEPKIYKVAEIACYFSKLLTAPALKDPAVKPRLTLVMSVCEGVAFAKNLQQKLLADYGLYIDLIANKNVLYEKYEQVKDEKIAVLTHKETSLKGLGREYKRPHSKVLLTLDKTGLTKEIDAYELNWISDVLTGISQLVASFTKWADFNKRENVLILKGLTAVFKDIKTIISACIDEDITLTANKLLALLQSCFRPAADPLYQNAMKYKMFQLKIQNLISEGRIYINPTDQMQRYLKDIDKLNQQAEKLTLDNVILNLERLKKADYSTLLFEASEKGIESVLEQLIDKQPALSLEKTC